MSGIVPPPDSDDVMLAEIQRPLYIISPDCPV
jgi:hypothetical protein